MDINGKVVCCCFLQIPVNSINSNMEHNLEQDHLNSSFFMGKMHKPQNINWIVSDDFQKQSYFKYILLMLVKVLLLCLNSTLNRNYFIIAEQDL